MTDTATFETKKSHFGGRDHRIAQLDLLKERTEKLAKVFAGTEVGNMLNESVDCVNDAIDSTKSLAADWKPAGRTAARKPKFVPEAGSTVQIRKKKIESYSDVLTSDEMQSLVVESVKDKMARCKTATGLVTLIRVSHLVARK